MARPRLDIDPNQVASLASIGCTDEEIADVLNCSSKTLRRRFVQDMARGKSNLKTKLRKKQVELALAGNVAMLTWLGKNILNQADKTELTGKDGEALAPPQPIVNFHLFDGTVIKPPRNGHQPVEALLNGDSRKAITD